MIKKKLFACVLAVALAVTGVGNVYAAGVRRYYTSGRSTHVGGVEKTASNGDTYYEGGSWIGAGFGLDITRFDNKLVINEGYVRASSYWDCFEDVSIALELHHSGREFGWSCGVSSLFSLGCTIRDFDDTHTINFVRHNTNWCEIDFDNIEFKSRGGDTFKISASGSFVKGDYLKVISTGTPQFIWD